MIHSTNFFPIIQGNRAVCNTTSLRQYWGNTKGDLADGIPSEFKLFQDINGDIEMLTAIDFIFQ